jgi:hypothetical protein
MTDLSDITYEDLLKEKMYIYNDDVHSQQFILSLLVQVLNFDIPEALAAIEIAEKEGRVLALEANYLTLISFKDFLREFNLQITIE